ncbi:hypothetical protein M0R04_08835 [Candidatus Dojkabacteria bacterium]|nr:hypothetical protein [Candidatus Dojkabacteria bacterium]
MIEIPEWGGNFHGKKYLPTFKKGDTFIVIKMLDESVFYNVPGKKITLRLTKGKLYYVPIEIAKELSAQGKCYYSVKPNDMELLTYEGEKEKWIIANSVWSESKI